MTLDGRGQLTAQQVQYLLRPIQPHRVAEKDGQSYLPQQDVRAHLTRIFGFGGWSSDVTDSSLVFEEAVTWQKNGQTKSGYDVLYRARVRLTIRDQHGAEVASYEDEATGDAQHQTRLAGHDLALKSAVSTALKRAATSLGDQFGLSLYNKGSRNQFVIFTLVGPKDDPTEPAEAPDGEVPAATDEEEPPAAEPVAELPPGPPASEHHPDEPATPTEQPPARPTLDQELAAVRNRRQRTDAQRRGPFALKGRTLDAVQIAFPNWTKEECIAEITDCLTNVLNSPDPNNPTDGELTAVAEHYEAQEEEGIRARHAAKH